MSVFKKPQDLAVGLSNNSDNDDIIYLLNLEVYKRFKEDESNIRSQVEEHERQYRDAVHQLNTSYANYVKLLKLAKTHYVLEQNNDIISKLLRDDTYHNIDVIKTALNRQMIEDLDENALAEFGKHLLSQNDYSSLQTIKDEIIQNSETLKAIHTSQENIENHIDTAVVQGLDFFVDQLKQ